MLTSHKLFFTTEVEDAELRKGDEEEEGTENGVSDICAYICTYTVAHASTSPHPPSQTHTIRHFSGCIKIYVLASGSFHFAKMSKIMQCISLYTHTVLYSCVSLSQVSKADFHLKAKWFHGKLTSRDEARRLLEQHKQDGAFLVRESEAFRGDLTLSFV